MIRTSIPGRFRSSTTANRAHRMPSFSSERRAGARISKQRNYNVEARIVGYPVYQFKIQDVSKDGIGIIVRPDSNFLKHIEVGQEFQVRLIAQTEAHAPGLYRASVEHISTLEQGPFKNHVVVGTRLMERV